MELTKLLFCGHRSSTGVCAQIRLLVEEASADVAVRDRWGNTPLDEATRVGARPCAQYLEKRLQASPRTPFQRHADTCRRDAPDKKLGRKLQCKDSA